jgi:hypothetical protein
MFAFSQTGVDVEMKKYQVAGNQVAGKGGLVAPPSRSTYFLFPLHYLIYIQLK